MSQPKTPNPNPQNNIRGEPLELEDLLDFATIDPADIESAKQWWDENASDDNWIGALDREPLNE